MPSSEQQRQQQQRLNALKIVLHALHVVIDHSPCDLTMQAPPQAPATAAAPSQTPAATGRSTFLAPHIAQSIQSGATITAGLSAASPDTAVSSVAKKLYGHQIKYLDVHSEEPSKVDKFLDKLHLGKSNVDKGRAASAVDDYKHDQTRDADSWQTDRMSPLSQAQLAEVMAAGQWGGTQPSELFLNVSAVRWRSCRFMDKHFSLLTRIS